MRLNRSTDIALRTLMALARIEGSSATRDIADVVRVPYNHLAKVVARLQHLDLVETRRGRGGGLAITPSARTASVGRIVRTLEGVGDVVECEGETPCPMAGDCRLRHALRDAQEAFFAALDPLTVEDLVGPSAGPVLVGLSPARPATRPIWQAG